jgi:hypothetical protein
MRHPSEHAALQEIVHPLTAKGTKGSCVMGYSHSDSEWNICLDSDLPAYAVLITPADVTQYI